MNRSIHITGFTFLLCSALVLISFTSCDKPSTAVDRTNPIDPGGKTFTTGNIEEFKVDVQSSGDIKLLWTDNSELRDGFLVEKSLNDTLSFQSLDIVGRDDVSYVDTTGIVRKNIYYRISSFIGDGDDKIMLKKSRILKPQIAPDPDFNITFNENTNQVIVDWQIDSPFVGKIELSVYQDDPDIAIFRTETENLNSSLNDDLEGIAFNDRIYVLKGFLNDINDNEIIVEKELRFNVHLLFSPQGLKTEFVTETEIHLRWDNRSFFEEELHVFKRETDGQMQLIATLDPGSSEFTDNSVVQPSNRYKVVAVAGNSESRATISEREFNWETEPRASLASANTDPGAIQLSFNVSPRNKVEELILMRKSTLDQSFEEIHRFGPEITHYTDRDTDQNKQYLYKLHTISTHTWSEGEENPDIEIAYMDRYRRADSFNHNGLDFLRLRHISVIDERYVFIVPNMPISDSILHVTLFDVETGTRHTMMLPEPESFSAFAVHAPNETFIVGSSNTIYEYSYPDGELIREKQIVPNSQLGRNFPLQFFEFDENYESIYANSAVGSIVKLDYETFEFEIFRQGGGSSRFFNKELALSNELDLVVTNDVVNYAHNTITGEEVATFGPRIFENSTTGMFFSYDQDYFVQLRYPERLETYIVDDWSEFHTKRLGFKTGIDLRPTAGYNVGGVDGNNIVIYDFVNRSYKTFLKTDNDFYKIKFINKDSFIVGTSDAQMEIWENQLTPEWTLFDFDN